MRPLTENGLLEVWEAGASASPTRRALMLLARAMPERELAEIARMPLGWRAARLLELRMLQFGGGLVGLAECPHCQATIEIAPSVEELCDGAVSEAVDLQRFMLSSNGLKIQYRLPCSEDLLAIEESCADPVRVLVERIVLSKGRAEDSAVDSAHGLASAVSLPAALHRDLEAAIEARDPHAHIELELMCPDCGRASRSVLDPVAFVWREIDAAARRLMHDVARLAAAFGWREADSLAVPPNRRARYLAMVAT